jgi:hypothetical protein
MRTITKIISSMRDGHLLEFHKHLVEEAPLILVGTIMSNSVSFDLIDAQEKNINLFSISLKFDIYLDKRTDISNNSFANGASMNNGNVLTERPSSRVLMPPGGKSSVQFF